MNNRKFVLKEALSKLKSLTSPVGCYFAFKKTSCQLSPIEILRNNKNNNSKELLEEPTEIILIKS